MKKLHEARSFLAGVLVTILVIGLTTPALAAVTAKTIEVYTGAEIYVDGIKMEPTDANGNPVDTFAYNGTTYVPLRAVSQYLGKAVKWDGTNRRVYIGEVPGEKQYLLDVCPPYETFIYSAPDVLTIAGTKYTKAFSVGRAGYAYFNLNGKYDTFSFDVGHVDGSSMSARTCNIYLDNELAMSIDVSENMMPTHYNLPLHGALQMRITISSGSLDQSPRYGFVNAQLS